MSRIGNKPIIIPSGITVSKEGNYVVATNQKYTVKTLIPQGISVEINNSEVVVKRVNDERIVKTMHGTTRANLFNAINGLHTPFAKELDIIGVGYRANVEGSNLVLQLGFSHDVIMPIPEGLSVSVDKTTHIKVTGHDKAQVGEFAAKIRANRKPEPYKGKGIRYIDEHVRRKAGKTAK